MKIELSRDKVDVVIDAVGNNIEHHEGRGIRVPEMHQLWAELDSYRQEQSVEQVREQQRQNMDRIWQLGVGAEAEQEQGMEI